MSFEPILVSKLSDSLDINSILCYPLISQYLQPTIQHLLRYRKVLILVEQ